MTKPNSDFLFVELAQSDVKGNKPFDGMAWGEFQDMWGSVVEITKAELQEYLTNTLENLEATRTESGELVGLPIDAYGHDHNDSAGWIVGLEMDGSGDKIRFTPKWTKDGVELIGGNVRRFFSPTINRDHKVILGGSLTNWPATRTKKGKILLRPIELSADMQTVNDPEAAYDSLTDKLIGIFEDIKNFMSSGLPGEPSPAPAEPNPTEEEDMTEINLETALANPEIASEIERRAALKAAELTAHEKRSQRISELAADMAGKGLATTEEITAFLTMLPTDEAIDAAAKMLNASLAARVDFEETGHGKTKTGAQPVPEWVKPLLKKWLEAGQDMEGFFHENAVELGSMEDYNLLEFQKKE